MTYRNKSIVGLDPHEMLNKGVAYMPQGRSVFPAMTVKENLKVGAYSLKDKNKARDNLEKVFGLFPQLKAKQHHRAGFLSGGEQKMIEFGRILMIDPQLILLDEPSVGLAPVLARQTYELVTRIREEKKTFLIVDQNIRGVLEIADYGYVISLGQVRVEGKPEELMEQDQLKNIFIGGNKP